MRYGSMLKFTALMACGTFGLLLVPACDQLGLGGDGGAGGSGGEVDVFADADPMAVGTAQMEAAYMAYGIQGMIEENVQGPDAVDKAMLEAMAEQYGPTAGAAAEQWVQSLSTIPAWEFDIGGPRARACIKEQGCKSVQTCNFSQGPNLCHLVQCGTGACDGCPATWNLSSLIVKGWCGYVCLDDPGVRVTGYAARIHWRNPNYSPWLFCYEAANQN